MGPTAVDVYSFGIVMWEIMHRQLPYTQIPRLSDVIRRVQAGERPTPLFHEDAPEQYLQVITFSRCTRT